jgi:thiaminase (transcriptional activator TenA)
MTFTAQIWSETKPLFDKILHHPFNKELMTGELDIVKFQYYIAQDALYLLDFAKALSILAAKSGSSKEVLEFLQFAEGAIVVEKALHEHYFQKFDIQPTNTKTPACFAYTNYLIRTTFTESYEVGVASLLPCFWIYREVGNYIYQNAKIKENPYSEWINTYGGEEYSSLVDRFISIVNQLASESSTAQRTNMKVAYTHSTRLEYWFWEADFSSYEVFARTNYFFYSSRRNINCYLINVHILFMFVILNHISIIS